MDFVTIPGLPEVASSIGFGCAAIGGYDYGTVDDKESIAAVHSALSSGINLFDTADVYGFGHSEEVLGEALSIAKSPALIATKGGVRWTGTGATTRDSSPDYLREALEGSLRRLRREYIDLYQIHWPDPRTPLEATLEVLSQFQAEGKIRAFGCCNFTGRLLEEAFAALPASSTLRTSQLSLNVGDTRYAADADAATAKGMAVLAYNVLAQGVYSGKYVRGAAFCGTDIRQRSPIFAPEMLDAHLHTFERISEVAISKERTPVQIAIRWVLDAAPVAVALVGLKSVSQVAEAIDATGWRLAPHEVRTLAALKEEEK